MPSSCLIIWFCWFDHCWNGIHSFQSCYAPLWFWGLDYFCLVHIVNHPDPTFVGKDDPERFQRNTYWNDCLWLTQYNNWRLFLLAFQFYNSSISLLDQTNVCIIHYSISNRSQPNPFESQKQDFSFVLKPFMTLIQQRIFVGSENRMIIMNHIKSVTLLTALNVQLVDFF